MSLLYIILPNFYAAVETELNPALNRTAFAVSNGKTIIGLSPAFPRNTSVKPGVSQAYAQEKAPDLPIIPGNIARYQDYSRRYAEEFCEIAYTAAEIKTGEFLLDTSHCPIEKLPVIEAIEIITSIVKNWQFRAGWADTGFLAEMAARTAPVNSINRLAAGKETAFMNTLPLKIIPFLRSRTHILQDLGAHNIGDLLNIPRPVLKQLFGQDTSRLLKLLSTEVPEQYTSHSGKPSRLWRFHRFQQNAYDPENEVMRLITSMTTEIIRQDLQADNLYLSLKYTDDVTISRSLKLAFTRDEVELVKASLFLLQELWKRRTALDSVKIELAVTPYHRQISFWENLKKERISLSVDTVRRNYGLNAVKYAMTLK